MSHDQAGCARALACACIGKGCRRHMHDNMRHRDVHLNIPGNFDHFCAVVPLREFELMLIFTASKLLGT